MAKPASSDYSFDQRLQTWKNCFKVQVRKNIAAYLPTNSSVVIKDPLLIKLENVEDDIKTLEAFVKEYKGDHKTDIFHHVLESKVELSIKLDCMVDFTDLPEFREKRKTLLKNLSVLLNVLELKIHKEHPTCNICVQRKIII